MVDDSILLLLEEAEESMQKSIEYLSGELSHIRAGRASPSMLDGIRVEFYGSQMPLNQVASISAPTPDLLVVQPWDKSALATIERAVIAANLGLNPSNDGTLIRIPVPPLSGERRQELVKAAHTRGEEAKIAIRNIRRSIKDQIKKVQQEEHLSEDMRYEGEDRLQKLTDDHIEQIDKMLERKEHEITEV